MSGKMASSLSEWGWDVFFGEQDRFGAAWAVSVRD
jgi:hypothetical protein